MKETKSVTKDPICGMDVDEATALNAENDGQTFYFCSEYCRQKFLSAPTGLKPGAESGSNTDKTAVNEDLISAGVAVRSRL